MDFCKVNKLKFQEEQLDRHIATLINNLNPILDCDKFNLLHKESEERRRNVKCTFKSEMTEIQNYIMRLEQFRDRYPHKSTTLPDDLNSAIVTLKDANIIGLQNLSELETKYTADLEIFETKIAGFQKTASDKSLIEKPSLKNKVPPQITNKGASSEVREFQRFLQMSGGHTGGWDDQDHRLFLKHRLKLKGCRMAEALHILLPDISPDAITEHDEWYIQYETLRAQQRCALKIWREGSRKESVATAIEVTDKDRLKEVKVDPAVLKELAEKKRLQIREWKLKKQELQLMEENLKAKKLHKMCSEASAKEEERKKHKHIIQEYKLKKAYLKEVKSVQKASEEANKQLTPNNKLLAMFQERDRIHVARTMQRIQEGKQPVEEFVPKVPVVVAERDPERLLRPTKAWVQHVDQQQDETNNKGEECNYINHLPHLKIPNWRKDL